MKKDAVMVLSGGMDSVTMLHDYADDIALAVTFGYGSTITHAKPSVPGCIVS